MNLAHVHLLLNHVPTVGSVIAFGLLLLSFVRGHDALRRASLELLCLIALVALPAYLSGVGTQLLLQEQAGVPVDAMTRHHDAALQASILMILTGGFAWLALWQWRRTARPGRGTMAGVLLLSAATIALMARAATLGGEIRHPEIVGRLEADAAFDEALDGQPIPVEAGDSDAAAAGAEAPGWITARQVAEFATFNTWVWPAAEALHFIGLWLIFGVVLLANLRLLGMMRQTSFAALHRLLPWAVLGLGVNIVTGILFVVGAPTQYMTNVSFHWKIGLLLAAGAQLLYLTTFETPWAVGEGRRPPAAAQVAAAAAIAAWIGVMYFGRMLPFIGNAF